jgi:N-acetyl-alpha-D-muramate 1-phosphate uridylyltransferase
VQALILAAGRGERLRPLTDRVPKPLVEIGGIPLIDHHLHRLRRAGISECVINTAHLGHLIEQHVGNGTRYGLSVAYSREPEGALETGGGIRQAMSIMRPAHFIAMNADIWTDFDPTWLVQEHQVGLAHLILVSNPAENSRGDFGLIGTRVTNEPDARYTFAGIATYHPSLFEIAPSTPRFPLAPLLRRAVAMGSVSGSIYRGTWYDIGTAQRLALVRRLGQRSSR